jgi:hypothetical protein
MDEAKQPPETVPGDVAVATIGFWEAQARTIQALADEAFAEYTSKPRIRQIALMALAHMMAMNQSAQEAEKAAQEAAQAEATQQTQAGLIVPQSGLIALS